MHCFWDEASFSPFISNVNTNYFCVVVNVMPESWFIQTFHFRQKQRENINELLGFFSSNSEIRMNISVICSSNHLPPPCLRARDGYCITLRVPIASDAHSSKNSILFLSGPFSSSSPSRTIGRPGPSPSAKYPVLPPPSKLCRTRTAFEPCSSPSQDVWGDIADFRRFCQKENETANDSVLCRFSLRVERDLLNPSSSFCCENTVEHSSQGYMHCLKYIGKNETNYT